MWFLIIFLLYIQGRSTQTCSGNKLGYTDESGFYCLSECPQNYYSDGTNCLQCINNCQSCQNQITCLSCLYNYVLTITNTCQIDCPLNQYQYVSNNSQILCGQCNVNCLTCYDEFNNSCLSCPPDYFLSNGSCLTNCIGSYFNEYNQQCTPCHIYCNECYGQLSSNCYSCNIGYFFLDDTNIQNTCYQTCPIPYYGQNQICVTQCDLYTWANPLTHLCVDKCPNYFWGDLMSQNCLEVCPNGTYPDEQYQQCQLCQTQCEICYGPSIEMCTRCAYGFYMINGICGNCTNQQYKNSLNRVCSTYLSYTVEMISQNQINQQIILKITFSTQVMRATLDFNKQVNVSGMTPNTQYILTTNQIAENQQYVLYFDFLISHRNTYIIINFGDQLLDQSGTPLENQSPYYQPIYSQFIEVSGEQKLIHISFIFTAVYLFTFIIIFGISKLINTQIRLFYIIINQLQAIYFLIFLNLEFPKPLMESLNQLQPVTLHTIPIIGLQINGTQIKYFNHLLSEQIPDNNFYNVAGYTYNFICNGGVQMFLYIFFIQLIWLLALGLKKLFENNQSFQNDIFTSIFNVLNDLLVRSHEILFLPLMILFTLQMWGWNFQDGFNVASVMVAIVITLYLFQYFKKVYILINTDNEDDNDLIQQRYGELNNDFNQDIPFKRNFLFIQLLYKLIYALVLILLNNFAWVQFSVAFGLQIIYLGVLIWKRPYKFRILSMVAILGQLTMITLMIIILSGYLRYNQFKDSLIISNNQLYTFYVVGLVFVVFVQTLLTIYVLLLLSQKLQDYLQFVRNNPSWGQEYLDYLERMLFSGKNLSSLEETKLNADPDLLELREFIQ